MTVHISGQVPGEELNGLLDIEAGLLDERTPAPFLAVVAIARASLKHNDVKQTDEATVRLTHIEPLADLDELKGRELLEAAYQRRTGNATLPVPLDMDES